MSMLIKSDFKNLFKNFEKIFEDFNYLNEFNKISYNIYELKDNFFIDIVAPGYDKNNFDIYVNDHTINISAKKNNDKSDEIKFYHVKTFENKDFTLKYTLPEYLDLDNITVEYLNGILQIKIFKKNIKKNSKKIEIK